MWPSKILDATSTSLHTNSLQFYMKSIYTCVSHSFCRLNSVVVKSISCSIAPYLIDNTRKIYMDMHNIIRPNDENKKTKKTRKDNKVIVHTICQEGWEQLEGWGNERQVVVARLRGKVKGSSGSHISPKINTKKVC